MTARNATDPGEWQQPGGYWDEAGYYVDEPAVAPEPQRLLQRIWTGRPMIYILAAALITVTALVLLTRPGAEPSAPAAAPPAATAPAPITYDAGPVIDNELNKP